MRERTIVVGGGITGASIAQHLAARGLDVTLVERSTAASGATGASFAWIGRPVRPRGPSAALRSIALDDWRRLDDTIDGVEVTWSGALTWGDAERDDGAPWTEDIRRYEPALAFPPPRAQLRADDGSLHPAAATEALVAAARSAGATVSLDTAADEVVLDGDRVIGVRTADDLIGAGHVVLANGVGAVPLAARIGITLPVSADPAILFRFDAEPGVLRGIVAGDGFEVRQDADGTVLSPAEYRGESSEAGLAARGRLVAARLARAFPALGDVRLRSAEVGQRPMPTDGEPIVGGAPGVGGLHVAVMHSAVTLAASVGRLLADEIAGAGAPAEFEGLRPPGRR